MMEIKCDICDKDDDWEGFEDVVTIASEENEQPEMVSVGKCACGHEQKVIL